MASLIVGGVTIPVAPNGISRDRLDWTDRARAFDGTYRASVTGNPKREFHFSTPPVLRATADFYELVLGTVTALPCSGDIIGGASNIALWSEDLTNAVWTKTTMTATLGFADPIGGTAASRLTATGANGSAVQSLSAGSSISRTDSMWIRSVSTSGVVQIISPDGAAWNTVGVTGVWQRFSITTAPGTGRNVGVRLANNADIIEVYGAQLEDSATLGPYVRTTSAAVSTLTASCCPEITGWTPVRVGSGHYVVLDFALYEA